MVDSAFAGLLTGLSLIVPIGAQNAYLLRQGLRRSHVGPVVAVRWLGVPFLTWYGLSCAWRARRPAAGLAATGSGGSINLARGPVVRRALALTWLNPHVYLDTVLLIGSVAATHGPSGRWWFAVGACVASSVWFTGVGFGARLLAPLLASPRAWQILDLLIAATMLVIAVKLATG